MNKVRFNGAGTVSRTFVFHLLLMTQAETVKLRMVRQALKRTEELRSHAAISLNKTKSTVATELDIVRTVNCEADFRSAFDVSNGAIIGCQVSLRRGPRVTPPEH